MHGTYHSLDFESIVCVSLSCYYFVAKSRLTKNERQSLHAELDIDCIQRFDEFWILDKAYRQSSSRRVRRKCIPISLQGVTIYFIHRKGPYRELLQTQFLGNTGIHY